MSEFARFLRDLGGLHDARVTAFSFDLTERSFSVDVDDIYSNFEGLPEYKGRKPARIKLMEISRLKISFDARNEEFNIDDFSVFKINEIQEAASILFWPEGKITMDFRGVEFPQEL